MQSVDLPVLCFCGEREGITTLYIFRPDYRVPYELVICKPCFDREDVFVDTTPLEVLRGRGKPQFTRELKEMIMKCNGCDLHGLDSLQSVQMKWKNKGLRLFFCNTCVQKLDLFDDATPTEVLLDDAKPTTPLSDEVYQFLCLIHGSVVTGMDYSIFKRQSCVICLRDNFKIVIETSVQGKRTLLLLCNSCAKKPNIFADYTPEQVFKIAPQAALFLTPLFSHYMIRKNKAVVWDDFK